MPTEPAQPFATDKPESDRGAQEHRADAKPPGGDLEMEYARGSTHPRPWRVLHLIYLVAGAAVVFYLAVTFGPPLVVFLIIGLVGALVGGAVILGRRRASRQDSLLWIMAIAAENRMPLAPAIAAFADQYWGRSHGRIMELASELDGGTSLPEALARQRKIASRDAVLLTRVGEATGQLPRALRIASTARSARLPIWVAIASRLGYLLLLLLGLQGVFGFLLYFIVPKFEAIFRDFGVSLPEVTVMMIDASHWMVKYFYLHAWVPIVELILLAFLPFSFIGWGNYDVPLFDHLLGRRHTALLFRSLALVVNAGRPIDFGLALLGDYYPTRWVRRRLVAARTDVRHGADWIESLRRHHLIRPSDGEVLRSAAAVGNLGWALDELAESSERRLALKFQMLVQTLFPLVVLMLGLVVFVTVLGFFAPLVKIISELGDR
ncbi:MAG: type II secretion system F family protein [Isosphaeraceae bacterium]